MVYMHYATQLRVAHFPLKSFDNTAHRVCLPNQICMPIGYDNLVSGEQWQGLDSCQVLGRDLNSEEPVV